MCHLQQVCQFGRTCILLVHFQHDFKNNTVKYSDTSGVQCVLYLTESKTKPKPNQKPKHAENDTNLSVMMRTEVRAEMISVVHCTKLELTVIQIAVSTGKTKKQLDEQLKYLWVHLQCGRWCWQNYNLFTCSAMMMKKEDGVFDSTAYRGELW